MIKLLLGLGILAQLTFGSVLFIADQAAASVDSIYSDCVSWCDRKWSDSWEGQCCAKGCGMAMYHIDESNIEAWKAKCYGGEYPTQMCMETELIGGWKAGCDNFIKEYK